MDNPEREIASVIQLLVTAPPSLQQATIRKYFTPDAAFTHPLCRTGSWSRSRDLIEGVYRWYKVMSPTIKLDVDSIAFDQTTLTLYVSLHQTFSIIFLPFWTCHVPLTTVLTLRRTPSLTPSPLHPYKYHIAHQNDLYQTSAWIQFLMPWFNIGYWMVFMVTFMGGVGCYVLAMLGLPVTWWEEGWKGQREVWETALGELKKRDSGLDVKRVVNLEE